MASLLFSKGILVYFAFYFNNAFGFAQSVVHHHLVVFDEAHLSLKFGVEMILCLSVHISLFGHRGGMTFLTVAKAIAFDIVLTQTIVKGLFSVGRMVHFSKASRVVGNISVTATSIVHINNRLGMNVS